MNTLSDSSNNSAGLMTGWFCCLFSLFLGLLWVSMSKGYGIPYRLFHPDMLGYILTLVGFVAIPAMVYASAAAACSYQAVSIRISRIVSFAIPLTLMFGWLLCRVGDALVSLGMAS